MKTYIIDDDNISVFLTEYALKSSGVIKDIYSFLSAEKALDFFKRNPIDATPALIFLDLNMPVMNGWEFLDGLFELEQEFLERLRIYILTSSLDLSDAEKWQNYSIVNGFLHKPIDKMDLQRIVAGV